MRICNKCKIKKNISDFYKNKTGRGGLSGLCKACILAQGKKYRQQPEIKLRAKKRELKKRYGITLSHYNQMYKVQNGMCAICSKPEIAGNKHGKFQLAVDHDHITGTIRALLCNHCNHVLGSAMDSKEILLQAALYLEQHSD